MPIARAVPFGSAAGDATPRSPQTGALPIVCNEPAITDARMWRNSGFGLAAGWGLVSVSTRLLRLDGDPDCSALGRDRRPALRSRWMMRAGGRLEGRRSTP